VIYSCNQHSSVKCCQMITVVYNAMYGVTGKRSSSVRCYVSSGECYCIVRCCDRYEGTGRSLSLKLVQQLRQQSVATVADKKSNSGAAIAGACSFQCDILHNSVNCDCISVYADANHYVGSCSEADPV
jgi:hypothetical protein